MYIFTITMCLTLVFCLGTYVLANMGFRVALAYLHRKEEEEISLSLANMSFSTPSLLDNPSIWDFYDKWDPAEDYLRHGLTKAEADALDAMDDEFYAQQLNDSIAAYEAEMDREWETEVTGYMYADIATMMALTTEDLYECYEDLPFTASMVRSAKPGKRGIVVMDNSDYERSAGTHNHKDHNHR